ncbi:hypothetical protein Tco_1208147, partial [Tanacetum coccineum]
MIHLQFQMEECHKLLTDQVDDAILRYNVSKPLPLGGEPGHVTIQHDFFFNKDLEYLRYSRKIGRPALSISKMKEAHYPDVGLEQMACSFMLCDLDFEPLSLSLSSLPSCDLMSLTNMLILLHYLESFKSEFAE